MRHRTIPPVARVLAGLVAGVLGLTLYVPRAEAGGYDLPGLGTRGLGRAGAWGVRTDSPLALHLNPANLARLSGVNVELSLHLASLELCFDRDGTPTRDGAGELRASEEDTPANASDFGNPSDYAGIEYPEVCNGGGLFPIPQLGLSFRPHQRVGVGIGLIAPNNVGHRSFGRTGGDNLGTYAVPGAPTGRLPVSTRYDLIEANVTLAYLTVGAGVELHPRLRIGASFGVGFATAGFSLAVAPLPDQDFARDTMTELEVRDLFVPRIGLSIAAEPVDGLELMAGFTWASDVKADGDVNLRPVFWGNIEDQRVGPVPGTDDGWEDVTYPVRLRVPQTSVLSFGARYALARPGTSTTTDRVNGVRAPEPGAGGVSRPFDPMRDEVFDLELDVVVTLGRRVDKFTAVAEPVDGQRLVSGVLTIPVLPDIDLLHNWKTQVTVALGGDINVHPETFALRWGLVYESHGVEAGYERLDFTPWQLFGGAAGFTLRVQRFEVSASYMYSHYFTVTRSPNDALAQAPGAALPGNIINAGRFTGSVQLASLGLSYRFR